MRRGGKAGQEKANDGSGGNEPKTPRRRRTAEEEALLKALRAWEQLLAKTFIRWTEGGVSDQHLGLVQRVISTARSVCSDAGKLARLSPTTSG
jgi:hypothetical protein